MKKIFVILSTICLLLLSFGLTACGSTEAKIVGINVRLCSAENDPEMLVSDSTTLAENDYVLQIEQGYRLRIGYAATGGSRYPIIRSESISLKYDKEVLEILPPDETIGDVLFFNISLKKSVAYTAILVEVDGKYFEIVVISAK